MDTPSITFLRRLGQKAACHETEACPDIWELSDGSFVLIGEDITSQVASRLPQSAGCSLTERIIRIPRSLLVGAKRDIPEKA